MKIIKKYFPDLSDNQVDQLDALLPLYKDWNAKINVISRKDIDHLYERHVLHSLAIAKWIKFSSGSKILDVGSGGGFPGIPLAIFFPDSTFHLVDSIGKKLKVVDNIAYEIGLQNVSTQHVRVESLKGKYDFVVSRAVASLEKLIQWTQKNINESQKNAIPNGIIVLKGGDLSKELSQTSRQEAIELIHLKTFFDEPFFREKSLIYVQG